jgi:hypothetical protein
MTIFNNCSTDLVEEGRSWCYTRTHPNGSGVVGYWGDCNPECGGKMPTRASPHNLAGPAFDHLWTTRVFSLRTWSSGICHTYNPPHSSPPGTAGLLYALIGDSETTKNGSSSMSNVSQAFRGLDIYLHDRLHFWPGLPAVERIQLSLQESVEVKFTMSVGNYLSVPSTPCTGEANYSLTKCLQADMDIATLECSGDILNALKIN